VIAVTAGLRIGELLGLRWRDVDLESAMLRVRRTKSTAKTGPRFTARKNGKGRSIRLIRRAVLKKPSVPGFRAALVYPLV
jgi:integrase